MYDVDNRTCTDRALADVLPRHKLATSQLALTKEASAAVYASDLYPQSTQNLSRVSLATDNVFSDGAELETPTITGSVAEGYAIALTAAIAT